MKWVIVLLVLTVYVALNVNAQVKEDRLIVDASIDVSGVSYAIYQLK